MSVIGIVLQAFAAVWLVNLELRRGRFAADRKARLNQLQAAIGARQEASKVVVKQTQEANELLRKGMPEGTPDRYSIEQAIASYATQIASLEQTAKKVEAEASPVEFPELGLVAVILMIVVGAVLQLPAALR
jgi:hypothetical protein